MKHLSASKSRKFFPLLVRAIVPLLMMTFLNGCLKEEEEVVKRYIYINSNSLFQQEGFSSAGAIPPYSAYSLMYVENVKNPNLIVSLTLKTDDGFAYPINIKDIYNVNYSQGAGNPEPIEIPNREFTKISITTSDVIKRIRYSNGNKTIVEKGSISQEFDVFGLYKVNTMQNNEPFTSPSGKSYGANGHVARVDLLSYTETSLNTFLQNNAWVAENTFDYEVSADVNQLNQSKSSGSGNVSSGNGSCLTSGSGTWVRAICGGAKKATLTFNGTRGTLTDFDCSGSANCSAGRVIVFDYQLLSNSQMNITYKSLTICGQSATPPVGGTQAYSCSGSTLVFGNTYTKQ
jgi:hypothetical protein